MTSHTEKYDALRGRLEELGSVLVAFSGGVDSTLLAVTAHSVLGDSCKAVLAVSDTCHPSEVAAARDLASRLGLNLLEVETYELADPRFAENNPDRCYFCKSELFTLLARVAEVEGMEHVVDGSNADDASDYRPGVRAKVENGVLSPLQEVGMTKDEIRTLSRELDIPNWNKPSMACLASRFPYGNAIDETGLSRVADAEDALRKLGLTQFRVRSHGDLARIEVIESEAQKAFALRNAISSAVKEAGFTWVAQDLDGYRSGSMNEVLSESVRSLQH